MSAVPCTSTNTGTRNIKLTSAVISTAIDTVTTVTNTVMSTVK
jgi:hypothetical protein